MTALRSSVWNDVLRALVYDAFAKRGTSAFAAACAEIVDTHARWPLVEYELALERARQAQALMRKTYR